MFLNGPSWKFAIGDFRSLLSKLAVSKDDEGVDRTAYDGGVVATLHHFTAEANPYDQILQHLKERDAETALDYFGARYYASRTARFTTVGPGHVGGNIFDPQSWNVYAYARNNPLRYVDPDGREYGICGYRGSGGSCGTVSDQYFAQLQRNRGSGFTVERHDHPRDEYDN